MKMAKSILSRVTKIALLLGTITPSTCLDLSLHYINGESGATNRSLFSSSLTDVGQMKENPSSFPLGLCEGDCDGDKQCGFGLACFLRDDIEEVPGCSGRGTSGEDYCYNPPNGFLVAAGETGTPKSAFPLGRCEGKCKTDADCQLGLSCFKRSGDEEVFGCKGNGINNYNYCIAPPPGRLVVTGKDGKPNSAYPLGQCEGECKSDDQCKLGLSCSSRYGKEKLRGCEGKGIGGMNYCYKPPPNAPNALVLVEKSKGGLENCQGDCLSDADCSNGLSCFKRTQNRKVPGCQGAGINGTS